MGKSQGRLHGKRLVWATAAGLFFLACLFVGFTVSYIRKFDRTLMEENEAHLEEIAAHIVSYTNAVVKDTQDSLRNAAGAVFVMREERRGNYMKDMVKRQGFSYVGYAWTDGMLHATEETQNTDISQETYFADALEGKSTVSDLTRKIMKDRAVSGILMVVPIYGREGEAEGALVAMLDIARLRDALSIDSFRGEGYSYIIDGRGELVVHNKSMDYNNFYRLLENAEIENGRSLEQIKKDILEEKNGLIHYKLLGMGQYAYYCPLGMNGWTVLNVVSTKAATAKTELLTKELVTLSVVTITVFLVLTALLAMVWAAMQNQRHAAETKSAFLANMSHEIRTPMNAIVGISEILIRSGLTDVQKEYARNILNSGKGLLSIINDILDLSKIEAGKYEIVKEEYQVDALLYEVTMMAVVRIGDKPVDFQVAVDDSLPKALIGDKTRIKQVLVNIIGNAVKFTQQGYVRLTVETEKTEEDGRIFLRMSVADTGIGIRKQDLEKLFISFNQVDTHHSHKEGTGLGLAISKALSQMMGGDVTVESEYGRGSVFTVTLLQEECGSEKVVKTEFEVLPHVLVLPCRVQKGAYYEDCLKKMKISGKVCREEEELKQLLDVQAVTHVIASGQVLERLSAWRTGRNVQLITLLDQKELSLMYGKAGEKMIYPPVFGIQLSDRLSSAQPAVDGGSIVEETLLLQPLPHERILIVDDNELNLEIANGIMEPYGMQIDCVLSGRDAVEAVKKTEYDLIFMDHMMPEMDGVETFRKIRNLPGGRGKKIPIIILTANATMDARKMFQKEGFSGFLAKPIEIDFLESLLEKWLRGLEEQRSR